MGGEVDGAPSLGKVLFSKDRRLHSGKVSLLTGRDPGLKASPFQRLSLGSDLPAHSDCLYGHRGQASLLRLAAKAPQATAVLLRTFTWRC